MPLDPGYEVPLREETQDEGKLVMRLHHPFNSLAEGHLPGTPKRVAMRNHPPEYTCSTYTTRPSTPFIYSFSFLLCVCSHHRIQCACGGRRRVCGSQFPPSNMRVLGIRLRLPGLATSAYTCRVIAWAPCFVFIFAINL